MNLPKLNTQYELYIESQSNTSDGVAHIDGYTLFISDAVKGDRILATVTKLNKTYGFAMLDKILEPSAIRQTPPCDAFPLCGGCSLMNITPEAKAEFKCDIVKNALLRLGGIDVPVAFSMPERQHRYRNKMIFPFSENGEWGFYKNKTHDVVPLKDCLLGDSLNPDIMNTVKDFCKKNGISFYNEATGKGILRRVFTRVSYESGEMMVVISVNADRLKNADILVDNLTVLSSRITSIILNVNKKRTNLVLGEKNITLWGKNTLADTLLGLKYEISPHSFFQINHAETEKLYTKALEYAEPDREKTVLDIYCGIGTISLSAAKNAKKVVGVEIVPDAIKNAKENAKNNGIENAEFYVGSAEDIVPQLIENGEKFDIVILDPPRKGSDEKTLSAILKAAPERIVYVSCNPATLARDLKFLTENGYKTQEVTAFDLFPETNHVESAVKLTKL
ncbi:MAG: 23S rRNA (uracil(1939)-C(5))-methyltransferase RlmD [Clostridia bacterium]|nr:23S rRNA (uracil(1939)-C(5))-methyltransferase RlmD [Clostridia bacterium]